MSSEALATHPTDTSLAEQIKTAEQQRCNGMINGDVEQLEKLLDARLVFCHATGAIDNKEAYLKKLASGRINYQSISWSEENIIQLGLNAILIGRMATSVEVEGVSKQLDNRVTAVWTQENNHWKLVSFQSTPMKI